MIPGQFAENGEMSRLQQRLQDQRFRNDYQLVDGAEMHRANPATFHVPPAVLKRQVRPGQFVELRIDSPRFSLHEEVAEKCPCPSCAGPLSKPILKHTHPASLFPLPDRVIPSRGWGEDFWGRISERVDDLFLGVVDNVMVESRLHGVWFGSEIVFHADHLLAVHDVHRRELVSGMDVQDLKELAAWLAELRGPTT